MRPVIRGRLTEFAIFTGLTADYLITLYVDKDIYGLRKYINFNRKLEIVKLRVRSGIFRFVTLDMIRSVSFKNDCVTYCHVFLFTWLIIVGSGSDESIY
jgi:hypothetical protein